MHQAATHEVCESTCDKPPVFAALCADGGPGSFNNRREWRAAPTVCALVGESEKGARHAMVAVPGIADPPGLGARRWMVLSFC